MTDEKPERRKGWKVIEKKTIVDPQGLTIDRYVRVRTMGVLKKLASAFIDELEKMAVEFVHPFPGKSPGDPLSPQEVISAIRLALCAEEEATHLYDSIAEYVDDPRVQALMKDIADEEQVHAGEIQSLLNVLEEDELGKKQEGEQEGAQKMGAPPAATQPQPAEKPAGEGEKRAVAQIHKPKGGFEPKMEDPFERFKRLRGTKPVPQVKGKGTTKDAKMEKTSEEKMVRCPTTDKMVPAKGRGLGPGKGRGLGRFRAQEMGLPRMKAGPGKGKGRALLEKLKKEKK